MLLLPGRVFRWEGEEDFWFDKCEGRGCVHLIIRRVAMTQTKAGLRGGREAVMRLINSGVESSLEQRILSFTPFSAGGRAGKAHLATLD